jgi:hypothetical protein
MFPSRGNPISFLEISYHCLIGESSIIIWAYVITCRCWMMLLWSLNLQLVGAPYLGFIQNPKYGEPNSNTSQFEMSIGRYHWEKGSERKNDKG